MICRVQYCGVVLPNLGAAIDDTMLQVIPSYYQQMSYNIPTWAASGCLFDNSGNCTFQIKPPVPVTPLTPCKADSGTDSPSRWFVMGFQFRPYQWPCICHPHQSYPMLRSIRAACHSKAGVSPPLSNPQRNWIRNFPIHPSSEGCYKCRPKVRDNGLSAPSRLKTKASITLLPDLP